MFLVSNEGGVSDRSKRTLGRLIYDWIAAGIGEFDNDSCVEPEQEDGTDGHFDRHSCIYWIYRFLFQVRLTIEVS
jgi:hypothetical protein